MHGIVAFGALIGLVSDPSGLFPVFMRRIPSVSHVGNGRPGQFPQANHGTEPGHTPTASTGEHQNAPTAVLLLGFEFLIHRASQEFCGEGAQERSYRCEASDPGGAGRC